MNSLDHLEQSLAELGILDIVARRKPGGWFGHAALSGVGVVFVPERSHPESTHLYSAQAEPYPQTLEAFLASVLRQAEKRQRS